MEFTIQNKPYLVSQYQIFLKIGNEKFDDEKILKILGFLKWSKVEEKEQIPEKYSYDGLLCFMRLENWVCIIDDCYWLFNHINESVSRRKNITLNLARHFKEILTIGSFSQMSEEYILFFYKNGTLKRELHLDSMNSNINCNKLSSIKVEGKGKGEMLLGEKEVFDFWNTDEYSLSVINGLGINLSLELAEGNFYKIEEHI